MKKVIPISKSSIGLKCGDCLFFKQSSKFERPCTELGVKHFSVAPACFSPNVYKLGAKNPDVILQLGLLLRDFDASDTRPRARGGGALEEFPGARSDRAGASFGGLSHGAA